MNHSKKSNQAGRLRRARRVRKKVTGTAARPRMSVSRSLKNVYVQLIDDDKGTTLLGVSSMSPDIAGKTFEGGKSGLAKAVGELVADKAKAQGITEVVFDRNGFLYHGRVKAVAEGARKGGLLF